MRTGGLPVLCIAFVLTASTPPRAEAQHTGDVWLGRSAAGQLKYSPAGFVPEETFHWLAPVSGLLKGWADDDPGFDRITTDDPAHDVFRLQAGVAVWLEVVSLDPALRLIDASYEILDTPGESTYLGDQTLHVHSTWHINSQDPQFDPEQCVWHGTFLLRDTGATGYASSEPLTLGFTNVPVRPAATPASGDFDADSFVDLADYAAFAVCQGGPGVLPDPQDPAVTTCVVECLNAFDFDNDRDVDLADFATLQARAGA